jgi:dUTP pyrophosphatase
MQLILTNLAEQIEKEQEQRFTFIPTRGTDQSAGYDIRACITKDITIFPGETKRIPLGFKAHLGASNNAMSSIAALILPRSGLGSNEGIVLGNLVGLVDEDYQDEWQCAVWNRNLEGSVTIKPHMRLAQVIFVPVLHPNVKVVEEFTQKTRRNGGFGHTGAI